MQLAPLFIHRTNEHNSKQQKYLINSYCNEMYLTHIFRKKTIYFKTYENNRIVRNRVLAQLDATVGHNGILL